MDLSPLAAGVELGGTKSIAVVARGRDIVAEARWPTGEPTQTLERIADWIAAAPGPVAALGVASFGPLCLDLARSDYGCIAGTPKPLWSGTPVHGFFASRFAVPIGFDTDVAGAALAEGKWGAAVACDVHVYVTIGTDPHRVAAADSSGRRRDAGPIPPAASYPRAHGPSARRLRRKCKRCGPGRTDRPASPGSRCRSLGSGRARPGAARKLNERPELR